MKARTTKSRAAREIERLKARLEEVQETLDAIRSGAVDAIVVHGAQGEQIFSMESADRSYQVLVEAMTEGAATLAKNGTILYCNNRFAEMLSCPLRRLMGASLKDFVDLRHLSTLEALLSEARKRDSKGEITLVTKTGKKLPAHLSVNSLKGKGGALEGALCLVATDLSDQKSNQEILSSERLARSILEQAGEAIVVCDEHERIIRVSEVARQLCGGNPLLQSFDEVFPLAIQASPEHPDVDRSVAALALRRKHFQDMSAIYLRFDGKRFDLLLSAGPLLGNRKRVLGCVITLTDVSRLKKVEANLQSAINVRDEFLVIASHELRTPLTSLQLQLQSAQRTIAGSPLYPLGEQVSRRLRLAAKQSTRLNSLIEGLLDVSRITQGSVVHKVERLDIVAAVRDIVERNRDAAERPGCTLEFVGKTLIEGNWDPEKLEQVVTNLISNAVKYGPGKPIVVTVDQKGRDVRIIVRDGGIGIAEADVKRIFKRFERAVSADNYGGFGLGLFIAHEIVEYYGGSIEVSSKLTEGSTFTVFLPKQRFRMSQSNCQARNKYPVDNSESGQTLGRDGILFKQNQKSQD